ncbi:MAG: tRNA (guanosine(46)-N7)-methyltransferase TrmB [Pseudomonadota bacterium]
MTAGQREALVSEWPAFGLPNNKLFDPACFAAKQPLAVEIGFGMGDSLFEMAQAQPDWNFVGIEVHRPGVGHLLLRAGAAGLDNLRVYHGDSVLVLQDCFGPGTIDRIQVFFPDPWHKKRHHKRRLINSAFVSLLLDRLAPGGLIHIATDWQPYAEYIEAVFAGFELAPVSPPARPDTKYEKRGQRLGHAVTDLAWCKPG